ncbi:phosphocholine cytidylyltransferase family protein [SAR202 cluster bacterium AD-493-K16_JPT_193m]|nr:phosphocholine cytidylyltransferase family protein [SAR202 cluster bacterium AD-493-K16_JPT_193m]
MRAIIVAAGLSSRLRPLTNDTPKVLLPVGDSSLITRSIQTLLNYGIEQITVVVGAMREKIQEHVGSGVHYVHNPFYAQTNNMASLWFALNTMPNEEFLYLHGDIIYAPEIIKKILAEKEIENAALVVDFASVDEEAMKVRTRDNKFVESNKGIPLDEAAGEWIGVARFSSSAAYLLYQKIDELLSMDEFQAYETSAFNKMADEGFQFDLLPTSGLPWFEIDTLEDLTEARILFS